MKPIQNVKTFLERFDHFRDGEFRTIEVNSANSISITLAGQDKSRAFDWISVTLECSQVSDARLLENEKLSLLDMSDGISIIKKNNTLAIAIGECYNSSSIKSASCFVECANIKYEEGLF